MNWSEYTEVAEANAPEYCEYAIPRRIMDVKAISLDKANMYGKRKTRGALRAEAQRRIAELPFCPHSQTYASIRVQMDDDSDKYIAVLVCDDCYRR